MSLAQLLLAAGASRMASDMRQVFATAELALVTASGALAQGSGVLLGLLIAYPGATSPGVTLYDNAGAASGTVLKASASAEMVQGGWLYCGMSGVAFQNGVYAQLAGGTLPIMVAVWSGGATNLQDVPPADYVNVCYFDGVSGNNANPGTIGSPRKSLSGTGYSSGAWTFYFKAGTTITIDTSEVSVTDNLTIRAYGSGAAPVISPLSGTNYLKLENISTAGKRIFIQGVSWQGLGSGVTAIGNETPTVSMTVLDCTINGYTNNGVRFCGPATVKRCAISNVGSGVFVGKAGVVPAHGSLTAQTTFSGTLSDGWVPHDILAANIARGHCCIANTFSGTFSENMVDIQLQFQHSLVAFNTGSGVAGQYPMATDGVDTANASFIGNVMTGAGTTGARLFSRGPGCLAIGNVLAAYGVNNNTGAALALGATSTGFKGWFNYFYGDAACSRNLVDALTAGSSGELRNNVSVWEVGGTSDLSFKVAAVNLAGWTLTNNCYYHPNQANTWDNGSGARTWAQWTGADGKDANSLDGTNPQLSPTTFKPGAAALRAAGAAVSAAGGPYYLSLWGVVYFPSAPSMGPSETQWGL